MSITFVSGLINIGRGKWENKHKRSFEDYISAMKKFLLRYEHPIVLFIEPEYVDQVKEIRRDYKAPIEIIPFTFEGCFYYNERKDLEQIIQSDQYQKLVVPEKKEAPEYWCIDYDILMFQKVIWLLEILERNPFKTDYFAWIDAGYAHGIVQNPEHAMLNLSDILAQIGTQRIFFQTISQFPRILNVKFPIKLPIREYFAQHDLFISGGFYIFHKNSSDILNLFIRKFLEVLEMDIIDDDQFYWNLIAHEHPDRFHFHTLKAWPEISKFFRERLMIDIGRKGTEHSFAICLNGYIGDWKKRKHEWLKGGSIFGSAPARFFPDQEAEIGGIQDIEDGVKIHKMLIRENWENKQIDSKLLDLPHGKQVRDTFYYFLNIHQTLLGISELSNFDFVLVSPFQVDFKDNMTDILDEFPAKLDHIIYDAKHLIFIATPEIIRDLAHFVMQSILSGQPFFIDVNNILIYFFGMKCLKVHHCEMAD